MMSPLFRNMTRGLAIMLMLSISFSNRTLLAEDSPSRNDKMRAAVAKALPLLEKASAGSAERRTCFTCHSQALPVMAFSEAKLKGFDVDAKNFERQVEHTSRHLDRGKKNYKNGKGQGGQVLTAGYALWALEVGDRESSETTTAVVHYLLERQREQGYWSRKSSRPPTSGSDFTNTYVAIRALHYFGSQDQEMRVQDRTAAVSKWLANSKAADGEDLAFRLRTMEYVPVEDKVRKQAIAELVEAQRNDGGWGQQDDMQSDAYATAVSVVALLRAGGMEASDEVVQRGLDFLLTHQLPDGSWHVKTRAKGFQKHFETGFPHGKDQFLSTAASSWAVIGLCLALPEPEKDAIEFGEY